MDGLNTALLLFILGTVFTAGGWGLKKLWDIDVKLNTICGSVAAVKDEGKALRTRFEQHLEQGH